MIEKIKEKRSLSTSSFKKFKVNTDKLFSNASDRRVCFTSLPRTGAENIFR